LFASVKINLDVCRVIPDIKVSETDIERVKQAAVLDIVLGDDLNWNSLVESIQNYEKGIYMVYQLKRAGIAQHDLVRQYTSVIRPVLEDPFYKTYMYTSLPTYLSDNIEII